MAKARKDHRGSALRKGEIQRRDKTYMYTYTDPYGLSVGDIDNSEA